MPLVINTNVAAINSQRQLMNSGGALDKAMERLSSGQRINSAKDDAAGLAISNRMTSQIRGLDQAIRNANDGISMIQTAEGAMQEVTNILQRMRELSIQSANGIYADADRSTLDAEVQQLKLELDRIADSTSFNGQILLDGSIGNTKLQVGSLANQTIDISIGSFNTSSLGGLSGDIVGEATTGLAALNLLTAGDLIINDTSIGALTTGTTLNNTLALVNASLDGKGALASATVEVSGTSTGSGVLVPGTSSLTLAVVDGDNNSQSYVITGTNSLKELVAKINEETGVDAKINDQGRLVLNREGALSITVTDSSSNNEASGLADGAVNFSLVLSDTSVDKRGVKVEAGTITAAEILALGIDMQDDNRNLQGATVAAAASVINKGDLIINGVEIDAITLPGATAAANLTELVKKINEQSDATGVVAFAGTGTSNLGLRSVTGEEISIKYSDSAVAATVAGQTGLQERNATEGGGSVTSVDISTADGAQKAIAILDRAIDQVNATRAGLGAANNRLEFTINNLANVSEKTAASRSRITDADFAAETAALSRAQVLQQAATAMLAQANARPEQVLSLLR
ncbi:MAG: flagellar biosynthesis protein FliC [Cellvibrio sp.]|nr:flagellar biosynthesis protein FliC [Cellvibrio sp.]